MDSPETTDKLYYTIGEVSRLIGLPASVLRFWETEFKDLRPAKIRGGKRLYRQDEIQRLLRVKKLLYEKRYTIEGARKYLQSERNRTAPEAIFSGEGQPARQVAVEEIRRGLKEILKLLKY